jgi:superfamily II RNA helicase
METAFRAEIQQCIAQLQTDGYIAPDGTLTQLGVMAAEINEGDPFDMARVFHHKAYRGFGADFLVAHLAEYVEHKKDEDFPSAIWDWMRGGDFAELCQTYGLDAGTFQKAILKTANILEEWITLAHICEDLETLEKLRGTKEKLVRGIVIPDSLYLRL